MKVYFDSSVLVEALIKQAKFHEACARALLSDDEKYTSTHALGETFASLTGGNLPLRFTPNQAKQVIERDIIARVAVVPLLKEIYLETLANCEGVGARGGAFYDVLHLSLARSISVDRIWTLNLGHFQMFAPDLRDRISAPP